MTVEILTTFFGWCTLINIGILIFSTVMLLIFKKPIANIHAKMFGVNPELLPPIYMKYLAAYKILIITFNIVPYVTLAWVM